MTWFQNSRYNLIRLDINSPKLGLILSLIHTNQGATFSTVPAIPLEIRRKTSVHVHVHVQLPPNFAPGRLSSSRTP